VGAAVSNPTIAPTRQIFQDILHAVSPRGRWEWRLQQLLYRSNYDLFLQTRAKIQKKGDRTALQALTKHAGEPLWAIGEATRVLDEAKRMSDEASVELWTELRVWAEALFQSVHEQFSVPIYGGEYTRRGNTLDTARLPLSNAPYIRHVLSHARNLTHSAEQHRALSALVGRTSGGVGGFYDDLGELDNQPHVVYNVSMETGDGSLYPHNAGPPVVEVESPSDQYYQVSPSGGDTRRRRKPMSTMPPTLPEGVPREQLTWLKTAGPPIRLRYEALEAGAYTLSFSGLSGNFTVAANGAVFAHGAYGSPSEASYRIPKAATERGGRLEIHVTPQGEAGEKTVATVAEAWLRRDI